MTIFGIALGLIELIFFAVFSLLMIIGVSLDRSGSQSIKWYVFFGGFIVLTVWFWSDWTFNNVFETVTSYEFLKPVIYYFVIGLLYSVLEFVLDVRRSARKHREQWEKFLTNKNIVKTTEGSVTRTNHDILIMASEDNVNAANVASSELHNYIYRHAEYSTNNIVALERNGLHIEPKINKVELSEHIGVWTLFWPFYALSLFFGDLLTEFFNTISNFLMMISGRFVKTIFNDVFKL